MKKSVSVMQGGVKVTLPMTDAERKELTQYGNWKAFVRALNRESRKGTVVYG